MPTEVAAKCTHASSDDFVFFANDREIAPATKNGIRQRKKGISGPITSMLHQAVTLYGTV